MSARKWWPSRKWWFAAVTAAGTITTMALTGDGINNDTEVTAVVGQLVGLAGAYILPNESN